MCFFCMIFPILINEDKNGYWSQYSFCFVNEYSDMLGINGKKYMKSWDLAMSL